MKARILVALVALSLIPSTLLAKDQQEVVHGGYAKAGMGYQSWVATPYVSYGPQFMFGGGYDFVDQLKFTVGAEVNVLMGTINGLAEANNPYDTPSPVQGDFQSFTFAGAARIAYNFGGKRVKRLSIYGRVGGGVWVSPSSRSPEDPQNPINSYGKSPHGTPNGAILVAVGLEYFTRLSHFSVGVEGQMVGIFLSGTVGAFSPAIDPNFFIKYTF